MLARSRQPFLVLGPALLALMFAVQPAAAATVIGESGLHGNYVIHDNQNTTRGADCNYETVMETHHGINSHWLDRIKVRGPQINAYNNGSGTRQYVGWQFKVQNAPTGGPPTYTTVYTSSIVKQKVNVATGFQFDHRNWTAPENPPNNTNWRVLVILKWFQRGSTTAVEGKVTASIDYYHVKGGGATIPPTIRQTNCYVAN